MYRKITSKFKNKRAIIDNINFASLKEAKRYLELKLLRTTGSVKYFLRQVPFHLNCGSKYVCDFMVFYHDGNVVIEDVKGFKTDVYKLKKKMVENEYGVSVVELCVYM